MVLKGLGGGGGFDYTQNTTPSGAEIGETWFDTSISGGTGKIYADLGNGAQWHVMPVQDELENGKTRELLMLLQDRPIPEIVDPLNIQAGLSELYKQSGSDYQITNSVVDNEWSGPTVAVGNDGNTNYDTSHSLTYEANYTYLDFDVEYDVYDYNNVSEAGGRIYDQTNDYVIWENTGMDDGYHYATPTYDISGYDEVNILIQAYDESYNLDVTPTIVESYVPVNAHITDQFNAPTAPPSNFKQWDSIKAEGVTTGGSTSTNPVEFELLGETSSTATRIEDNNNNSMSEKRGLLINPNKSIHKLEIYTSSNTLDATTAYVTDSNGNVIQSGPIENGKAIINGLNLSNGTNYNVVVDADGRSYTIGYYDSPSFPYHSENVDIVNGIYQGTSTISSTYAIKSIKAAHAGSITTSHIPKSELADSKFRFRDREYIEDAASDGQSTYTISETGNGGHFGIPIFSLITVERNDKVLDESNWGWDGTDTVTVDTSNVTISSGDTITIFYDLDVFDSELKPRAYLSRESDTETSPSISHFRYEYLV